MHPSFSLMRVSPRASKPAFLVLAKPWKVATHILTFARPLGFSKPSPSLRHPSSPLPGPPHCPRIPSALPLTHLASRLCPTVNQLHVSEN